MFAASGPTPDKHIPFYTTVYDLIYSSLNVDEVFKDRRPRAWSDYRHVPMVSSSHEQCKSHSAKQAIDQSMTDHVSQMAWVHVSNWLLLSVSLGYVLGSFCQAETFKSGRGHKATEITIFPIASVHLSEISRILQQGVSFLLSEHIPDLFNPALRLSPNCEAKTIQRLRPLQQVYGASRYIMNFYVP